MPDWRYCDYDELKLANAPDCGWKFDKNRLHQDGKFFWSEKTVEAKYIQCTERSLGPLDKLTFAPLVGGLERLLGDAVTKANGSFEILEFKASKQTINTEIRKFRKVKSVIEIKKYKELFPYMRNYIVYGLGRVDIGCAAPHQLIYGFEKNEQLFLRRTGYWGNGVELKQFNGHDFVSYVLALSYFRQPPQRGGLSGFVHAITQEGAFTLDLSDVIEAVRRLYAPKPEEAQDYKPGGMM